MQVKKIGIFSRFELTAKGLAGQIRELNFDVEGFNSLEGFRPQDFAVIVVDYHGELDSRIFNRLVASRHPVGTVVFSSLKGTKLLPILFEYEVNAAVGPTSRPEALKAALEAAAGFESFFDEQMLTYILSDKFRAIYERINSISPREWEIIDGVLEDLTNEEIALRYNLSIRTVNAHKRNILQKLETRSLVGLTRMMMDFTTRYD